LTLDFGTSANLLLLEDEDAIFDDDLLFTDRLLPDREGSFFFVYEAVVLPARDALARMGAALFTERVDDCSLASSLEAFDKVDTTDLESVQTELDDSATAGLMLETKDFTDLPLLTLRLILSTFLYEIPGGSD